MARICWIQSKYAISCPRCGNELNWFERSFGKGNMTDTDYLKCITCDMFFIKGVALTPTDVPRNHLEHLKKQGYDDEGYQGVPTSYFYKPEWLRKIEKILRIH